MKPKMNTYLLDWYISDQSEDDHKTEYFIKPVEQPLAPNSTMPLLLTISGAPQSSSYLVILRIAALRIIKQQLPSKQRPALIACHYNIS